MVLATTLALCWLIVMVGLSLVAVAVCHLLRSLFVVVAGRCLLRSLIVAVVVVVTGCCGPCWFSRSLSLVAVVFVVGCRGCVVVSRLR